MFEAPLSCLQTMRRMRSRASYNPSSTARWLSPGTQKTWSVPWASRLCTRICPPLPVSVAARPMALLVRLRVGRDPGRIELVHLVDQLVRDDRGGRHFGADHFPFEQEVLIGVEILQRALAPARDATRLELPMLGPGEQRLHVLAQRLLVALPARLRLRVHLVEDLHRGLGVRHREPRAHRVPLDQRDRLGTVFLQGVLEGEETVGGIARDGARVEQPHRDSRAVDQRILRVVERERRHLVAAQQRGGLGGLSHHDDLRVLLRVEPVHRQKAARDVHASRPHRGHADLLALEVLDRAHGAVLGHRDPVDVPLICRVEDPRLDALLARRGQRLDRGQRVRQVPGRVQLHAVGRAGHRDQLHLDPGRRVPAFLHRDGEGSGRRGDGARAEPDLDHRFGGAPGGRGGNERRKHRYDRLHGPPLSEALFSAAFWEGSQNRTRRRTDTSAALSRSPSTARMKRMANSPATSMLKFLLWMSMPRPASAPTNSATMAPTSEKTIATSRPAMMNGSADGRRSMRKICSSLAASERMRSTRSSSADRSPAMVFTSSGKKEINAALTTLEVRPSPNQTTTSGASATLGIDWNMTMYG